ncbi:CoA transferase [Ensifer sp. NM-2]|jgi:crotonobetainyl-CoA:carnitine CoA-transferase CaiB-like acyl-CoA transferase|uniref:CaiB/BaiF CoA transferase family protein n=1 Tax=Ensifer sp. NM-2 TaxID=2109730 RepID=UPI000D1358A9|nr:CoA transferase [Ensifer sp. NM-2]PSS60123.1 CoA transferase [Ensifer sp. NM-2]
MKPLEGIRILDFSRVLAGPMATQILAELGATVTKVERPGSGDESRVFEPRLPGGESAYFFAFNRGKRSLTLNLKSSKAQEIAARLAAQHDVVLENFLPGDMDRFDLGYTKLSALNPGLIYVSNTGFGQTGPYRERAGYDTVFQALSGIMHLTGHPDTPPAKAGVPIADLTAGLWIAIAILTGLVGRGRSGKGCHIDLAMMDVQASLLALAAARLFALDEDIGRAGTEHPGRVPSAAFQCRDGGWLHISGSDQHWGRLCDVLGLTELGADPALAKNGGRVANRKRVMDEMRTAIAARERGPLAEALRAVGIPAGEVNTTRQILDDPHMQARGVVGTFDHPAEGTFKALRTPVNFEGFDSPEIGCPPLLGADTETILRDEMNLTDVEIATLRKEGAIG